MEDDFNIEEIKLVKDQATTKETINLLSPIIDDQDNLNPPQIQDPTATTLSPEYENTTAHAKSEELIEEEEGEIPGLKKQIHPTQDSMKPLTIPRRGVIRKEIVMALREKIASEFLKKKQKKENVFSNLFSMHAAKRAKSRVMRRWRVAYIVAVFLSMLRNAYVKIKVYGAVRSENQMCIVEKQYDESVQSGKPLLLSSQVKSCMIYPNSQPKNIWDLLIAFVLLLLVITTPYRVSFRDESIDQWTIFYYIIDALFLIDILITFMTAIVDKKNNIVDSYKAIALAYVKGSLIIDLISIFPFNLVFGQYFDDSNSSNSVQIILRMLRFAKVFKIVSLFQLSSSSKSLDRYITLTRFFQVFEINEGFIEIMNLLLKVLYLNHVVACFWHYTYELNGFEQDSWVQRYSYAETGNFQKYIASMYWAIQTLTTVGYGDIAPQTNLEMTVAMLWMFFGVGFLSYTMGSLNSIISGLSRQTDCFNQKVNTFSDFTLRMNIPSDTKKKVMNFYLDNYFKKMYYEIDPHEEIQLLPQQIKNELLLACFEYMKDEIALFRSDDNFTSHIVQYLKLLIHKKGEIVYRAGDFAENVYFLAHGRIYLAKDDGNAFVYIQQGSFFGEQEVMERENRAHFAVAEEKCQLYFCSAEEFRQSLAEFSTIREEVNEIMRRRKDKYKICSMLVEQEHARKQQALQEKAAKIKANNTSPKKPAGITQTSDSELKASQENSLSTTATTSTSTSIPRNNNFYIHVLAKHQQQITSKSQKTPLRSLCKSAREREQEELNKVKETEKALEQYKDQLLPTFSFKKHNNNILNKTLKKFQTSSSIISKNTIQEQLPLSQQQQSQQQEKQKLFESKLDQNINRQLFLEKQKQLDVDFF